HERSWALRHRPALQTIHRRHHDVHRHGRDHRDRRQSPAGRCRVKNNVVSFVAGLMFAVGLALAGMGQPSTVVGFLDFTGRWNPSLMLLMCAGIPVVLVAHRISVKLAKPIFAERFPATSGTVDGALLAGAAIFGAG